MWDHKLSRHQRGYGYEWTKLRSVALKRDSYTCIPCQTKRRTTPATQVDHIKPKAQGGTDDLDNLQSICDDCHKAKTAEETANGAPKLLYDGQGFPIW